MRAQSQNKKFENGLFFAIGCYHSNYVDIKIDIKFKKNYLIVVSQSDLRHKYPVLKVVIHPNSHCAVSPCISSLKEVTGILLLQGRWAQKRREITSRGHPSRMATRNCLMPNITIAYNDFSPPNLFHFKQIY